MIIMIVCPFPFWFEDVGNRTRVAALVRYLVEKGLEVHIFYSDRLTPDDLNCLHGTFPQVHVHERPDPNERHRAKAGDAARKLIWKVCKVLRRWEYSLRGSPRIRDYFDFDKRCFFETLCQEIRPQAIICEYLMTAYLVKHFSRLKLHSVLMIDTIDVLHQGAARARELGVPHACPLNKSREANLLKRFDVIIAIQERDAEVFRSMKTGKPVITVPHPPACRKAASPNGKILQIGFIGASGWHNVTALKFLAEQVLPLVWRQAHAQVQLVVAGSICETLDGLVLPHNSVLLGRVESINVFYDAIDVAANFPQLGSGLKIKNVEALCQGKPLVTNSIGAQGIEDGSGRSFIMCDSPAEAADAIIRLLESPLDRQNLAKMAYEFGCRHFNPDSAFQPLIDTLEKSKRPRD